MTRLWRQPCHLNRATCYVQDSAAGGCKHCSCRPAPSRATCSTLVRPGSNGVGKIGIADDRGLAVWRGCNGELLENGSEAIWTCVTHGVVVRRRRGLTRLSVAFPDIAADGKRELKQVKPVINGCENSLGYTGCVVPHAHSRRLRTKHQNEK